MLSDQTDRGDALAKGTHIRNYAVEAVLGHGGYGIVYRARHIQAGDLVALKEYMPSEFAIRGQDAVVPRNLDCEEHYLDGLRRFRDEAEALINLPSHPNVVSCRDFFTGNGTAYLVMDFVDGQPLSKVLRSRESAGRPFEEADLLAVVIPLLDGLAHVHRANMLHRDLKPANILIRRDDERPVLIDFGAAKQSVAENSKSLAPYTEGYAALEQVSDGKLGPWTDLYGLGAVMWRIIAGGKPPWRPPNPVKVESRARAILRVETDPLPSAQQIGARRYDDTLLDVVDSCLELQEHNRPKDCQELLGILAKLHPVDGRTSEPMKIEADTFARVDDWLRQLWAIPNIAAKEIVAQVPRMVDGLDEGQLDLMARRVFMDDWAEDLRWGLKKIPIFDSREQFAKEYGRIVTHMAEPEPEHWEIWKRLAVWHRFVDGIMKRMVKIGLIREGSIQRHRYITHQVQILELEDGKLTRAREWCPRSEAEDRSASTHLKINVNLMETLEAEAHWLTRAVVDLRVVETLDMIDRSEGIDDLAGMLARAFQSGSDYNDDDEWLNDLAEGYWSPMFWIWFRSKRTIQSKLDGSVRHRA